MFLKRMVCSFVAFAIVLGGTTSAFASKVKLECEVIDANFDPDFAYERKDSNLINLQERVEDDNKVELLMLNDFAPVDVNDYYGISKLKTMSDRDVLVYVYNKLASGIGNKVSKIEFKDLIPVTMGQFEIAFNAFRFDNPQFFYYNVSSYKYTGIDVDKNNSLDDDEPCTSISPIYLVSSFNQGIDAAKDKLENAAQAVIVSAGLSSYMSDYEKAKRIHDILAGWIDYQYSYNGDDDIVHTAYGALVNHVAVCDGYARAYQYVLYKVGILSHIVAGCDSRENHAWNIVRLNEGTTSAPKYEWYLVDLTWNDQDNMIIYNWFNLNDEGMGKDHFANKVLDNGVMIDEPLGYDLPICMSNTLNFYVKNGVVVTNENKESAEIANSVIRQFDNDIKARVYMDESISIDDKKAWINYILTKARNDYYEKHQGVDFSKIVKNACFMGDEVDLFLGEVGTIRANDRFETTVIGAPIGNYQFFQALYNKEGLLESVTDMEVNIDKNIGVFVMPPWEKGSTTEYAKYMLWSTDSFLKPISKNVEVRY